MIYGGFPDDRQHVARRDLNARQAPSGPALSVFRPVAGWLLVSPLRPSSPLAWGPPSSRSSQRASRPGAPRRREDFCALAIIWCSRASALFSADSTFCCATVVFFNATALGLGEFGLGRAAHLVDLAPAWLLRTCWAASFQAVDRLVEFGVLGLAGGHVHPFRGRASRMPRHLAPCVCAASSARTGAVSARGADGAAARATNAASLSPCGPVRSMRSSAALSCSISHVPAPRRGAGQVEWAVKWS